jgi:hypothetical protein
MKMPSWKTKVSYEKGYGEKIFFRPITKIHFTFVRRYLCKKRYVYPFMAINMRHFIVIK